MKAFERIIGRTRHLVSIVGAVAIALALADTAGAGAAGGCPSINAIGNFLSSPDLSVSFTISTVTNPNDTATYTFSSTFESPSGGCRV